MVGDERATPSGWRWPRPIGPSLRCGRPRPTFTAEVHHALLQTAETAGSALCVIPWQDVLGQRDRINLPGTVQDANWSYRIAHPVEELLAQPDTAGGGDTPPSPHRAGRAAPAEAACAPARCFACFWPRARRSSAHGPVVTRPAPSPAPSRSARATSKTASSPAEANFFSYVFGPVPTFDPTTWTADLRRIERYYQSLGFYQAEVVEEEVVPDGKGGVRHQPHASTRARPPTSRRSTFEGLEALPEGSSRRRALAQPAACRWARCFARTDWTALKALLKSRLRELGYADAAVGGEAYVEVTNQTARVHVIADPGPRVKFGSIFVTSGPHSQVEPELIIAQARGRGPGGRLVQRVRR